MRGAFALAAGLGQFLTAAPRARLGLSFELRGFRMHPSPPSVLGLAWQLPRLLAGLILR